MAEVHVGFGVDGHEVDVCVRNFESEYGFCYACAWNGFLDGYCHFAGKQLEVDVVALGHVEEVVNLLLGYDECVAGCHGVDVEECEVLFVLGYFVAWNLACHNLAEY